MFVVDHLAKFCWKCLAKTALVLGGTGAAAAGSVMLVSRLRDAGPFRNENVSAKISTPFVKTKVEIIEPEPPPPPPVITMPVSFEFADENEGEEGRV